VVAVTVPPARQCTLPSCEQEAVDPTNSCALCAEHLPDDDPAHEPRTDHDHAGAWDEADFIGPENGIWPAELLDREQWMGHIDKKPFAPWGDRDAPAPCTRDSHDAETAAECDCDARRKWGYTENYVDGETIGMAEIDPRLDGRAFLQQPDDPYAYVDGDDVRDPETGEVHPAFVAILEHLGLTYADVSQSGAGVHAIYRGDLPEGVKQAAWQLDDEPWGGNDEEDLPSVEIYPGKRVCVMTGAHVAGTPTEVRDWNADVLDALLEANDEVATSQRADADPAAAKADFDAEAYDPQATHTDETATDIRDLFAALDRIDARRVAERTIVHAWNGDVSTSDGYRAFYPTWGRNSNGTANIVDDQIWQDTGDRGGYGGPVVMALIDLGELTPANASPRRATGAQWFRGVEHLRELGFDIPTLQAGASSGDAVPEAVLPEYPALRGAASGWDWRHAGGDVSLTIDEARERTVDAIADAYEGFDRVLIEALPTMGKSYGSIAAAARTGEPMSMLTGRGRVEQYEQFREWCDEHGLDHYTLPSFTHDCDTANGEYGAEWKERARDWYTRGATPQEIHMHAETELGEPLPCQREGKCPYAAKWDFDPDDYDVLIGHYAHAHKAKVSQGRTAVFDEFPGSTYEMHLDLGLEGAISYYLACHDALPFEDYTDLIEGRHDEQRRADALAWFQDQDLEPDADQVFMDRKGHAAAPLATFTILAGAENDLGNGWERAPFPDHDRIGLFNRATGVVRVLSPPDLGYTRGVVALDGTPTQAMWNLVLGEDLNHRPVLQDGERADYLRDALNLNLIRTTEWIKPYNGDNVDVDGDAALLEAIGEAHDQRPAVITTTTAEQAYADAGVDDHIAESQHYGNVLGSNQFAETRVGAVIGSQHYGDRYVKKWGAYAGEAVERGDGKGAELSYGEFGDDVLTHMREHETLQAAMRFGRDGNGAVVYVHTNTLPDWVPVAGEGRVIKTWSEGMRQVVDAVRDLETWTTAEVAQHPSVEIGERQVRDHLSTLRDREFVARETEGCGFVWRDDGLHRVNDHGEVELDSVDVDDLSAAESAELSRSSIYTWEFRTSPETSTATTPNRGETAGAGSSAETGDGSGGVDPGGTGG